MTTQPPNAKINAARAPQIAPVQSPLQAAALPAGAESQGGLGAGSAAPEIARSRQPVSFWDDDSRKLVIMKGSCITPKPVEWLWEGWIAKGFITIFAGETGAGKSTVLADIAARVTTGQPWPGEVERRETGHVLWLGSEDPLQEVTIPRLMASGANLEHTNFIIASSQRGRPTTVSLQEDLGSMIKALDIAKAQDDPISIIVIDPVTSYLSGKALRKVDMNDAGQIRTVLEPWSKVASLNNVAIVCVTHFAKDTNRSMLNRVLGSGAFSALSRGIISITTLPEEAQDGNPFAKAMFLVKSNLPERPEGAWRFSTTKTTVFDAASRPISTTKISWDNEPDSTLTPENVIGVGKGRGPVSHYGIGFPIWLKAQFLTTPEGYGLPVAQVKAQAIAAGVASADWWKHHWHEHMQQWSASGIPYCRPIAKP